MIKSLPIYSRALTICDLCTQFETVIWAEETASELIKTARDCEHQNIINSLLLRVMPQNIRKHFESAGLGKNLHNLIGGDLMTKLIQHGQNKEVDSKSLANIRFLSQRLEDLGYLCSLYDIVEEKDVLADEIKSFLKPFIPKIQRTIASFITSSRSADEFYHISERALVLQS